MYAFLRQSYLEYTEEEFNELCEPPLLQVQLLSSLVAYLRETQRRSA